MLHLTGCHLRPIHRAGAWREVQDLGKRSDWWYVDAAKRARRLYYTVETALLVTAAIIPAVASFTPDHRLLAGLGVTVVIVTGLRQIFRWHENWMRFTEASVQLITERELYKAHAANYAPDDRDVRLVRRVRQIEEEETRGWMTLRKSATPPGGAT
jgi:hypothetical protein